MKATDGYSGGMTAAHLITSQTLGRVEIELVCNKQGALIADNYWSVGTEDSGFEVNNSTVPALRSREM